MEAGRAIGVAPPACAAMAINSTLSRPIVPCSQSISTQSNPRCPAISAACGDGIITDRPIAGPDHETSRPGPAQPDGAAA